jgi:hypothetical protein
MTLILSSEHIVKSFNSGDAIFQLLFLVCIALIIGVLISIVRSIKNRTIQLERIEKKIDSLNKH